MDRTTRTLQSQIDGLEISLLEVTPEGAPRGVLQLVHGMSEHKERYLPFMEYMAGKGFACVIHDHRGHGESLRSQEDYGYMYGGGGEALVQDVRLVNAYIRHRFPGKPVILFGHSMGSLIVRAYLKKYDRFVRMAVICGTPGKNSALPVGKALACLEERLFGGKHKSRILEALTFGAFAARFPGEKSRFAWTCSSPEVVREYEESDLCGFTFTADGYRALFEVMGEAYSTKNWKCRRPGIPILFISGGEDPCMGSIRKFKLAVEHMRSVGYRDVRGKVYPGMRHEILNESQKEKVFRDVYRCIVSKLKV